MKSVLRHSKAFFNCKIQGYTKCIEQRDEWVGENNVKRNPKEHHCRERYKDSTECTAHPTDCALKAATRKGEPAMSHLRIFHVI